MARPRLASFQEGHADIDLCLHASDDLVDLSGDTVDIAVRYGRGPYPSLMAEVMFTDRFAPVVHPRLGVVTTADLERAPLIHFLWTKTHPLNPTWESWFLAASLPATATRGQLRFSDEGHAIQAAVAGQGVALVSLALVGGELATGQLVQPFGPTLPGHTYQLVTSTHRPPSESLTAALEWLRSESGS